MREGLECFSENKLEINLDGTKKWVRKKDSGWDLLVWNEEPPPTRGIRLQNMHTTVNVGLRLIAFRLGGGNTQKKTQKPRPDDEKKVCLSVGTPSPPPPIIAGKYVHIHPRACTWYTEIMYLKYAIEDANDESKQ